MEAGKTEGLVQCIVFTVWFLFSFQHLSTVHTNENICGESELFKNLAIPYLRVAAYILYEIRYTKSLVSVCSSMTLANDLFQSMQCNTDKSHACNIHLFLASWLLKSHNEGQHTSFGLANVFK